MEYNEINVLAELIRSSTTYISDKRVKLNSLMDGGQIRVFDKNGELLLSIVEHSESMGHEHDRLEIADFRNIKPYEHKISKDPGSLTSYEEAVATFKVKRAGWLSAEAAFYYITQVLDG